MDKYHEIREYLDHVLEPWTPLSRQFTDSHKYLLRVQMRIGVTAAADLLDQYFAEMGADGQRDPFNKHNYGKD